MQNPRPVPDSTSLRQGDDADPGLTQDQILDVSEEDSADDPNRLSLEEIAEAEASRPDLPGETVDGLDEMEEEIRHQAEDVPSGPRGRE